MKQTFFSLSNSLSLFPGQITAVGIDLHWVLLFEAVSAENPLPQHISVVFTGGSNIQSISQTDNALLWIDPMAS